MRKKNFHKETINEIVADSVVFHGLCKYSKKFETSLDYNVILMDSSTVPIVQKDVCLLV